MDFCDDLEEEEEDEEDDDVDLDKKMTSLDPSNPEKTSAEPGSNETKS